LVLKKPTRVAVLPVGYQNGYGVSRPREVGFWSAFRAWQKNKRRSVRIGGQRAYLLGPIGSTETVLDVTNLKCSVGDLAVFEIDPLFAKGFTVEYR
jgi:alanine racemase